MKWLPNTFGKVYSRKRIRLCILSLNASCGTTHLALACANYYASMERYSVLYAECVPNSGVIGFRTSKVINLANTTGFRFKGVDYMPVCDSHEAMALLDMDYDVVIVEAVALKGMAEGLASRCSRRIFTLSARPWHYNDMQMNMKQIIQQQGIAQGDYCSFAITGHEARKVYKEFHLRTIAIPFIEDPFCLKKQDIRFLKQLLRG